MPYLKFEVKLLKVQQNIAVCQAQLGREGIFIVSAR